MTFPPCTESYHEFLIQYSMYGPMCIFVTGLSFVLITLDNWSNASKYERFMCILVLAILYFFWIFILPLFVVLEIIKFLLLPFSLLIYIFSKQFYESYPYKSSSSDVFSKL